MKRFNNLPPLKPFRQELRNNSTLPEIILWKHLQHSQLNGKKFRRQHSYGRFILDFYCPAERLAVELDGAHHFTEEGLAYDEKRTRFLNEHGIRVVRFENDRVFKDVEGVLGEIKSLFRK